MNWMKRLGSRLRGEHRSTQRVTEGIVTEHQMHVALEELAPFEECLNRLYRLAESAKDPVAAVSYMSVAREMDEELVFLADDLFYSRLASDDLPKVLEDWKRKGRGHLIHHGLHSAAFEAFESATSVDEQDETWAWVERGGVGLGHVEMMTRIEARANRAHQAGERDIAWQLDKVANQLERVHQDDGLAAIQTATTRRV
jgi:hypothetical protein